MKRLLSVTAVLVAMTFPSAHAADKAAPHWGYEGETGPAAWGKEFPTCGLGKAQSPIDIKGPFEKATQSIKPDYKEGALKVVNNGHTIQVNVDPGSKLQIDKDSYELLQFHFHRPSEEKINGKPSAMVAHFVHKNAAGKLAVVGVLFNEGKENATLKTIWAAAPKAEGPEVVVQGAKINPASLLPKSLNYYSFEGSLTTPPCSEGVTFYILKSPSTMAKAQIDAFPFKANARPVQPLNGRKIVAN
jgi:carbonic anhydrase